MKQPNSDRRLRYAGVAVLAAVLAVPILSAPDPDTLSEGFRSPPPAARLRCYWWWLNGHTTEAAITRDLEQMKAKGYGGALLVDADGSNQQGNDEVPAGPMFGSPAWRALFVHALAQAQRLGLEISLNVGSGWNMGGPTVKPEESAKLLTWSRITVQGPADLTRELPQPRADHGFYRDIAVLAYPLRHGSALPGDRKPIRQLNFKSASAELGMSMPRSTPLLDDFPAVAGEEDTAAPDVRDVTANLAAGGQLTWQVPDGTWEILRMGYAASGAKVSTSSQTWQGLALDYLDRGAIDAFWVRNVAPLLEAARPYLGNTLRYLVTDSWEAGGVNWSARFRDEFRRRRGYDPLLYLPIVAGRIVGDRDTSNRFLNDLRRTVADLIIDEHYRPFAELAARYGLGIHPESGGPHGAPIDALETLGIGEFPQTEYWAPSAMHRTRDEERFFVKEASSAAHIYGKTLVAAEGMTSIGPQWEETPASLKPAFDQAVCEGLNRLLWHTFTSSPRELGVPGQEYFAGTHLNPNVTWWDKAGPFFAYLNRIQFLMQAGHPVADVLYYYGDHVPNFVQLKSSDPGKVLPGYDYDVTDEYVLTHRLTVRDGRLQLPDGVTYRLLVLPDLPSISVDALRAVKQLVADGASVVGSKPKRATGMLGDAEVRALANDVWGDCGENGMRRRPFGKGTVYCGESTREVLAAMQIAPDFEGEGLDYVHRWQTGSDIYFIRNTQPKPVDEDVVLRSAQAPEIWNAEAGAVDPQAYQQTSDGRIRLPLHLEPNGSTVVVLHGPLGGRVVKTAEVRSAEAVRTIDGPWTIAFPSGRGAPGGAIPIKLGSWTENADPGIRYFSGTATYTTRFQLPGRLDPTERWYLDLGDVREIAEVRVNGRSLPILWKKPFRVLMGAVVRPGWNQLEVEVTNLWPNRLIGDQLLPPEKRFTWTNITKFKADSPLLPSGLLGPVTVEPWQVVESK
jgi:hypothetical protein